MTITKLLAADTLGESGIRAMRVQENCPPARVVVHTVRRSREGGIERAGPCAHDLVADHEPDLALEHGERVHLVGVPVRSDARPGGFGFEPEHGELGTLAEDRVQAVIPPEVLAASGLNDQGVRRRSAAVGRRRVLVEVASPAQVVGKAGPGRVEVQEAHFSGAVVGEAVHDPRRDHDERAGGRRDEGELGADLEGHRAVEHVEGVDVMEVDVRLGAALPGRMTCPRHVQPVVLAENSQLAGGRVGDRLAPAVGRG
jgi:hypothetical protein